MWSTSTHKRHNRGLQSCRNSEFLAQCNHQATITCSGGLAVSSRTAPLVASVRQQMSFTKRKSPEKTTTKWNTTSPRRSQHSKTDSTTTHLSPPKVRDWNRTLNNIIHMENERERQTDIHQMVHHEETPSLKQHQQEMQPLPGRITADHHRWQDDTTEQEE